MTSYSPPSYLSAVSSAAMASNGLQRPPMASAGLHTMQTAAAVNASPSAFALMGAHQQHQLLQARMAASNLALAANAAAASQAAAAAAASIGSSTSPGSTNSSPDEKNSSTSSSSGGDTPMSRTNQYKKVRKVELDNSHVT